MRLHPFLLLNDSLLKRKITNLCRYSLKLSIFPLCLRRRRGVRYVWEFKSDEDVFLAHSASSCVCASQMQQPCFCRQSDAINLRDKDKTRRGGFTAHFNNKAAESRDFCALCPEQFSLIWAFKSIWPSSERTAQTMYWQAEKFNHIQTIISRLLRCQRVLWIIAVEALFVIKHNRGHNMCRTPLTLHSTATILCPLSWLYIVESHRLRMTHQGHSYSLLSQFCTRSPLLYLNVLYHLL